MVTIIKPPYPYFGGKYSVKDVIWQHFGPTSNFVDPFFGGGSSLWFNPAFDWQRGEWTAAGPPTETVNDIDGYIANFWRAIRVASGEVVEFADWPVNENDLHARHSWLVNNPPDVARLEGDPDYYDSKIAGWWVWGICAWIGSGFASGQGPWQSMDGRLVNIRNAGQGINRQRPQLRNAGQGINRQRREWLEFYFARLQDRLRSVRVCCGDWRRVLGPTPTERLGLTAIFLDPPYGAKERDNVYNHDSYSVANDVRAWATKNGNNPMLRIALCGYDDFAMPNDWILASWQAAGGYESQGKNPSGNRKRERIWFSPHCAGLNQQLSLFGDA